MRRFVWLLTLALTMSVWESAYADETITVSSTSSDIAAGLDLKAVAKIFASAKNLEEFENLLNHPDSSYVNLDLNGDGDIDYIRVVETGSGNSRLVVLQAIIAKDIFQDVASIRIVKDETKNNVNVTITGDERIYGENYVIQPVYVYRPIIYDWFWGPDWYCWTSPYYWGYWPGWWHPVPCWGHEWYVHHIYAYHHAHPVCSFHYSSGARPVHHASRPVAASPSSRTTYERTRYAAQSSYVPNRTTSPKTANTTTTTPRPQATSVRNAQYTNSTRNANYTNTPHQASTTSPSYTNTTRSSSYSSTSSSYSGSRSAGGYSGGGSARSAGGYSGSSVRR